MSRKVVRPKVVQPAHAKASPVLKNRGLFDEMLTCSHLTLQLVSHPPRDWSPGGHHRPRHRSISYQLAEAHMPLYIIERNFAERLDLKAEGVAAVSKINGEVGVNWLFSWDFPPSATASMRQDWWCSKSSISSH